MQFAFETCCSNNLYHWYVVHCKARREFYAAGLLKGLLGLRVFLPECNIRLRSQRQRAPYLPGYIFVYANLQEGQISLINSCPGVLRLVTFDGIPQSVPHYVVETLYQEVNRLNTLSSLPHHGLCPGDPVRIIQGPLQGLETIFASATTPGNRVRIFLHLLGRLKEVQIDVDALEKIHVPFAPQLQRSSRGKGRSIKHQDACS